VRHGKPSCHVNGAWRGWPHDEAGGRGCLCGCRRRCGRGCGRGCARGWVALLLCTVLLSGSALSAALVQRWAVERERQSGALWAHAQAQALGQAGLMWTLARLEDPRPIDLQCRAQGGPVTPGHQADAFAARMAQAGRALRCVVDLAPGAAAAPWRCDCSSAAASTPWPAPAPEPVGLLEIDFSGSGSTLRLGVRAQVQQALDRGPAWQESVWLQADRQTTWRALLGSWKDAR
jgi:hypothetical protein